MRRFLVSGAAAALLLGLVGLGGFGCAAVVVEPGSTRGPAQGKAFVCHKGKKTLEVAAAALDAHLAHGDRRGRCR